MTINVLQKIRTTDRKVIFWSLCYLIVVIYYSVSFAQIQQCGEGFTSAIKVGGYFYDEALPEFKKASPRVFKESYGYDAQFYAQIALDPSLKHPGLPDAIDNLPYRGRRILMPSVAWLAGGGNPKAIVNIFPLINPICWLISAIILLKWLPPCSIQNFLRWAGILMGWGWLTSTTHSLTDGPAATLTLVAAYLILKDRPYRGAIALAASALTKDVSILAGLAIYKNQSNWKPTLIHFIVKGTICTAPVLLWYIYIDQTLPQGVASVGSGNFSLPFVQISTKLHQLAISALEGDGEAVFDFLCFVGIAVQMVFILLRPRWNEMWWRIGVSFAVLGAVLGPAVWASIPSAAPRVLLVMHIAFNILIPKTRVWLPLLLLGNLNALDFRDSFTPPPLSEKTDRCMLQSLILSTGPEIDDSSIELIFLDGWRPTEIHHGKVGKWTEGVSRIQFTNLSGTTIKTVIELEMGGRFERDYTFTWNGEETRSGIQGQQRSYLSAGELTLEPGPNILTLSSDTPDQPISAENPNLIGACLFEIRLSAPRESSQ